MVKKRNTKLDCPASWRNVPQRATIWPSPKTPLGWNLFVFDWSRNQRGKAGVSSLNLIFGKNCLLDLKDSQQWQSKCEKGCPCDSELKLWHTKTPLFLRQNNLKLYVFLGFYPFVMPFCKQTMPPFPTKSAGGLFLMGRWLGWSSQPLGVWSWTFSWKIWWSLQESKRVWCWHWSLVISLGRLWLHTGLIFFDIFTPTKKWGRLWGMVFLT